MLAHAVLQLRNEVEELKQKITTGEPSNLPATTVPNIQTPIQQPTISPSEIDFQAAEEVLEDDTLNINDMEKRNIIKSLQRNHYRRKEAADELGISVRTLYRKLKAYGIEGNAMTKIKLCGLSSVSDIEAANAIKPEYIV